MTTLIRISAIFIYVSLVALGIQVIVGLFTGVTDGGFLVTTILFVPIALLGHLYAQAHFSVARRADNYIKFCKVHEINNDKEYSEEFFKLFKKESK
jgi:hypothetical protein